MICRFPAALLLIAIPFTSAGPLNVPLSIVSVPSLFTAPVALVPEFSLVITPLPVIVSVPLLVIGLPVNPEAAAIV